MSKNVKALLLLSAVAVFASATQAQQLKVIRGGVLNGKAVSLPKPAYPEGARAAGIGGVVGVDVEIDENGIVVNAKGDPYDQREERDVDGNKIQRPADTRLIEAAEAAAWQARFSPTMLQGKPVRVQGRVMYNFVPSGDVSGVGSAPVLNSKATEMPMPAYSPAAKAVNAQGSVAVQVEIDAGGNVVFAKALSGHPLLRSAAEQAARSAKFSADIDTKTGVLVYNFVQ